MPVSISNIRPIAPTTVGGLGSVLFDLAYTAGQLLSVNVVQNGPPRQRLYQDNLFAGTDILIPNLPANRYNLDIYGPGLGENAYEQFTIPAFVPDPRGGCTDPRDTLNYDPAATFDDGSCQYVPLPVPEPVFGVSPLNSGRYVQVEIPDDCTSFETRDNTLFCAQRRPGQQLRPRYVQPVCYCDPLPVQVLTNLESAEAVVHALPGGQVMRTQQLDKVLALDGPAPFAAVELASAGDGNTLLLSATGGLPASLLAAPRVQLRLAPGGPLAWYRVLRSGRASVTNQDDYLVINRPYTGPVGGFPAVSWLLRGPGFNVWEGNVDLSGLAEGEYEIRLHGYDAANRSATAIGEPLRLAAAHPNTVVVEYRNTDNAFGTVFATGFTPRLRVPGTFFREKNTGTETEHRNSDGSPVLLASTAQRLVQLETYDLPAWVHEKLFVACRLDYLRVNGLRGKAVGGYERSELRGYPLTAGRVDIEQVGWLASGNGDDAANDTGETNLVLRVGGFLKLRR